MAGRWACAERKGEEGREKGRKGEREGNGRREGERVNQPQTLLFGKRRHNTITLCTITFYRNTEKNKRRLGV